LPGDRDAITIPEWQSTNIYVKEGHYTPCGNSQQEEETFLLLAHELVHALQVRDSLSGGGGFGIFNAFNVSYLTCLTLNGFRADRSLPYEQEAYDYANGTNPRGKLRACIEGDPVEQLPPLLPCDCSGVPWLTPIPNFLKDLFSRCRDIAKTEAEAGLFDCIPFGIWGVILLFGLVAFLVILVTVIVLLFVVALVITIVNFFRSIISFFGDLFSGDGVGNISLLFSTDKGVSFDLKNKVTFEESSEPPALAASGRDLYVGWVGTDNQLNAFTVPASPRKVTFEESNDDAGPALVFAFSKVFIVWQDSDNHLHLLSSPSSVLNFGDKHNLGESLAGSATPGLAFGNDGVHDRLYLAWVDDDNRISIKSSLDGVNWGTPIAANERSPDDGTPALAFGNGRLYLAWTGTDDDNHLNIKPFSPLPDGSLQPLTKKTFSQRSSDDAGPALALGNGRLFLAWTDDNQRLNFMFTDDPDAQIWQPPMTLGHSSDNAGPALAFIPQGTNGIVCVAWIDK
jgi:hypothetical protein